MYTPRWSGAFKSSKSGARLVITVARATFFGDVRPVVL